MKMTRIRKARLVLESLRSAGGIVALRQAIEAAIRNGGGDNRDDLIGMTPRELLAILHGNGFDASAAMGDASMAEVVRRLEDVVTVETMAGVGDAFEGDGLGADVFAV